jgi:hypothetical protein
MFTIKKVTAVALATLMLSVPAANAAETTTTPAPVNSLTPREQAVIDFHNSLVAYTTSVRVAMDKHRSDLAVYRTAMDARQIAIRPLADARQAAVSAANSAFASAVTNATTQESRDALVKTRKDAITLAHTTFKSAVDALGVAPVKPAKPAKPTLPAKPVKPAKAAKTSN